MTREEIAEILGSISPGQVAAIEASGASVEEMIEAKAILDGKSDIAGIGERPLRGRVRDIVTILTGNGA